MIKMLELNFDEYKIELINESSYKVDSFDNTSNYDLVYQDEESKFYQSTYHGVKVYKGKKLFQSAIVCATAGATGVHGNSAVIVDKDILICCADKIFSLSLPNLKLNWMKQLDDACCFGIYKTDNGLFVHGELAVSRIDKNGNTFWYVSFADITVTPEGDDCFILRDNFIEVEDWQHNKYKINFDGSFI